MAREEWEMLAVVLRKVTRQRIDPEKNGMIEDVLIYSLDSHSLKVLQWLHGLVRLVQLRRDKQVVRLRKRGPFLRKELHTYFESFILFH